MKKNLLTFILLFMVFTGFSQLVMESGANIVVESGSSVIVTGGITSTGATFDNKGTIENKGDLVNNTSVLFAASSTGTFKFNGTAAQEVTGDNDVGFYGVTEIDNTTGVSITNTSTGADQTINGELKLTNGTLSLNGFNLTIGSTDPTGAGASAYVKTNSTGTLKRSVPADGSTNVTFPVGNSAYNPLTLQNSDTATADTYGVRVVDNEPAGSSTIHMVDRSWEVTEATSGGSDLTVTAQWNSGEELIPFNRDNCAIGLIPDGESTYTWGETGAASGGDPYTMTNSSFTDVGTFAVGDYFYSGKRLDLKFFLAGAYNVTTMNQTLYTKGLIPLSDPYGLGTTVSSIPSNAVDWVVVRLRDKNDSTSILKEYAFFIDPNGNLLNKDGSTGGKITGVSLDSYYIEVNHRNHNGIMTLNTLDLNTTSPSFNFTTNTNIYGTNPQVDLGSGIYGLRKGNVNNDSRISKVGPPSINDYTALLNILGTNSFLTNLYSDGDINMDGDVRKVGPPTINDYTSLLNSLGTNTFIMEQLP